MLWSVDTKWDKLLWIDMEMTGLDVQRERIIEVAAIITDSNFNPLQTYESVVFQDPLFIKNMDEWNTKQHGQSGLLEHIPKAPKEKEVEEQLCSLVSEHFGETPAILCGNTIGQDRKFIDAYMPNLSKKLHYRMLDVTAWKLIMGGRFQVVYEKKETHRALDDIQESIEEMKTFINFIEKSSP